MVKFGWKIWLLIIAVIFSLIAIFGIPPKFLESGVVINSVEKNSTAFDQGLRQGQIITEINGNKIESLADFSDIVNKTFIGNDSVKFDIQTDKGEFVLFLSQPPKITISNIPSTNLKTGLDLSGGARALVQGENHTLTTQETSDLVSILENRFNTFGISDVRISPVSDLSNNHFILIEIAGVTPSDLNDLISQQGNFEAKIGNDTVFIGGKKDITSVARSGQEAGITSCSQDGTGVYYCNFQFALYLSPAAAERQGALTQNLSVVPGDASGNYLSQPLDLYLDGQLVDSLRISQDLRGRVTTQISITGSGSGTTNEEAIEATQANMNKLQTILITGSLPFKLQVSKLDTISPTLGADFVKSILFAGFFSLIGVAIVVGIRYKKINEVVVLLITVISEIIIILGVAALISWNLDLLGIAGILATIGTGIDQQIIILDESRKYHEISVKERLKRAFAIIIGAYFTALVSLLPLLWAGAGLLKGFAVTTLIGITIGILITRPAFTDMVKSIEE
ncbi:MAG: PDZ domain-containing protein [Nanoarchaeota archaeon]|nr:PDZ domain-containing protein [Nanoarchaeota archaeon]